MRIPDAILYINGLPLVVFEFKSAIREEEANRPMAGRNFAPAIAAIFRNCLCFTLCIISDGVNNCMGNLFASYDYFYSWRKVSGNESREQTAFIRCTAWCRACSTCAAARCAENFYLLSDTAKKEIKIGCRYPQYYAARKLFSASNRRVNHTATAKVAPISARHRLR